MENVIENKEMENLKNNRILFLKENLKKIQTAQANKDTFLAGELLIKYSEYEYDFSKKLRSLIS